MGIVYNRGLLHGEGDLLQAAPDLTDGISRNRLRHNDLIAGDSAGIYRLSFLRSVIFAASASFAPSGTDTGTVIQFFSNRIVTGRFFFFFFLDLFGLFLRDFLTGIPGIARIARITQVTRIAQVIPGFCFQGFGARQFFISGQRVFRRRHICRCLRNKRREGIHIDRLGTVLLLSAFIFASRRGCICIFAKGIVRHEHQIAAHAGFLIKSLVRLPENTGYIMRGTPDLDLHADNIGRAEQSPCSLIIEQNPVMHQVIIRKIVAVQQFQRMKIEKISSYTDGIYCNRFIVGGNFRAAHAAIALIDEAGAVVHL